MRSATGVLSVLYGAIAVIPLAIVSVFFLSAEVIVHDDSGLVLGIISTAMAISALALIVGGGGILLKKSWGPSTASTSAIVITLGTFAYFWLMQYASSMSSTMVNTSELILATLKPAAITAIPMFVIWWCNSPRGAAPAKPGDTPQTDSDD
ncbi:MAG: hypothetical protein ABGZ53_08650 [Fuerstiella sp.]